MHTYTAILDTRPGGSLLGIPRKCPICHRTHQIWACFREVKAQPVPGDDNAVRYAPTGSTYVVGTDCARRVTVPVWMAGRMKEVLRAPSLHAVRPGDRDYPRLLQEFQ